jgi:hypothetical protein
MTRMGMRSWAVLIPAVESAKSVVMDPTCVDPLESGTSYGEATARWDIGSE